MQCYRIAISWLWTYTLKNTYFKVSERNCITQQYGFKEHWFTVKSTCIKLTRRLAKQIPSHKLFSNLRTYLCRNSSFSLLNEVELLTQSLDELLRQTVLAENKLKDLQDMQIFLEKDLDQKRETIHLETVRCLPRRSAYPSALRLQGYP